MARLARSSGLRPASAASAGVTLQEEEGDMIDCRCLNCPHLPVDKATEIRREINQRPEKSLPCFPNHLPDDRSFKLPSLELFKPSSPQSYEFL